MGSPPGVHQKTDWTFLRTALSRKKQGFFLNIDIIQDTQYIVRLK